MPLKNSITNPAVGSPRRSSRPERVSPEYRGIRNYALQTFSQLTSEGCIRDMLINLNQFVGRLGF